MLAVKLLITELVTTSRPIVTNLPIQFDGLAEYLSEHHEDWYVTQRNHFRERITIIKEEQLQTFFLNRGKGQVIAGVSNDELGRGKFPDFSQVNWGVAYFIDEVHIAFNARNWGKTGHQVLYYLSQHGKLGDTVVCITQSVGNVDKQFRSVAQDFTYVKNLSKQKFGLFKLPGVVHRSTFLSVPTSDAIRPCETGTFKIDVAGLGKCYDTSQGVGIFGAGDADKKEIPKGIDWKMGVVAVVVIVAVCGKFVPNLLAKIVTKPANVAAQQLAAASTNKPTAKPIETTQELRSVTSKLVVAGYVSAIVPEIKNNKMTGRQLMVLSDGIVIGVGEQRLVQKGNGFFLGESYYLWKAPSETKSNGGYLPPSQNQSSYSRP